VNLDILIRIRDQLTGLTRASDGLLRFKKEAQEGSRNVGQLAQALGPAGGMLQRFSGPFTMVAAAAMAATSAFVAFDTALRDPRRFSSTDEQVKKIEILKQRLGALAAPVRIFTDSGFRAESAAIGLRSLSDALGFGEEARSAVALEEARNKIAARNSERDSENAAQLADQEKRRVQYAAELLSAKSDEAQVAEQLESLTGRDIDKLSRMRDSYLAAAGNSDLSELARTRARTEAGKIELILKQDSNARSEEAIALSERSAQLGDAQATYARSLLLPKEQLVQVEMELLELKTRQAEIDKSTQAGFAQSVALEERLFELAKERDQLKEQAKERDPDKSKDSAEMGQMDQLDRNDAVGQMTQSLEMLPTLAETAGEAIQTVYGGFTNSIYGALQGLWNRTMTLGDALRSVAAGFASSMLQAIAQIAAQWVARQILMATVGKAIAAASVAALIPMAMAQSAIWAAPATLATIASFGAAAAQAPASMAAALAAGQGLAAIPGFADGGGVDGPGGPRSDSILARLSDGEYVIPAATVDRFGRGYFDALLAGVIPAGRTDRAAGMQAYMAPAAMAGAGEGGSGASGVPSVAFASFNNQQHAEQWLETQGGERYMVNFLKRRGFKHT